MGLVTSSSVIKWFSLLAMFPCCGFRDGDAAQAQTSDVKILKVTDRNHDPRRNILAGFFIETEIIDEGNNAAIEFLKQKKMFQTFKSHIEPYYLGCSIQSTLDSGAWKFEGKLLGWRVLTRKTAKAGVREFRGCRVIWPPAGLGDMRQRVIEDAEKATLMEYSTSNFRAYHIRPAIGITPAGELVLEDTIVAFYIDPASGERVHALVKGDPGETFISKGEPIEANAKLWLQTVKPVTRKSDRVYIPDKYYTPVVNVIAPKAADCEHVSTDYVKSPALLKDLEMKMRAALSAPTTDSEDLS